MRWTPPPSGVDAPAAAQTIPGIMNSSFIVPASNSKELFFLPRAGTVTNRGSGAKTKGGHTVPKKKNPLPAVIFITITNDFVLGGVLQPLQGKAPGEHCLHKKACLVNRRAVSRP